MSTAHPNIPHPVSQIWRCCRLPCLLCPFHTHPMFLAASAFQVPPFLLTMCQHGPASGCLAIVGKRGCLPLDSGNSWKGRQLTSQLFSAACFSGIPLSHITLNSNSVGSIFLNSNPYFSPQTWAQEVQIWEALVQGPGTSWKCALAPPVGKGGTRIHKYKSTTVRSFLHR